MHADLLFWTIRLLVDYRGCLLGYLTLTANHEEYGSSRSNFGPKGSRASDKHLSPSLPLRISRISPLVWSGKIVLLPPRHDLHLFPVAKPMRSPFAHVSQPYA
jgi:hypothetical protein